MMGFFEFGNEPSVSHATGEFLEKLMNYQVFNKHSAPSS
jgi:hypothetical protein